MTLDIVFCVNAQWAHPLVTAINSIVMNSSAPASLRFNIAVPPAVEQQEIMTRAIDAAFPDRDFAVRIRGAVLSDWITDYIESRLQRPVLPTEGFLSNYARFEVQRLFDDLGTYVYLDADLVVRDDIAILLQQFDQDHRLAAVPFSLPGIFYFRNPLVGVRKAWRMLRPFNAGVYVTDTRFWDSTLMCELQSLMEWDRQNDYKLFWLHTEPLMNLVFTEYQRLPRRWNRSGYGNHPLVARFLKQPVSEMSVIHWSGGHRKPWRDRNMAYADEWWAYDKGPQAT